MLRWIGLCCSPDAVETQITPDQDFQINDFNNANNSENAQLDELNIPYHDIPRLQPSKPSLSLEKKSSLSILDYGQSTDNLLSPFNEAYSQLTNTKTPRFSRNGNQYSESVLISIERLIHQYVKDIVIHIAQRPSNLSPSPISLLVYSAQLTTRSPSTPRTPSALFERIISGVLLNRTLKPGTESNYFGWLCESFDLMNALLYDYPRKSSITPYLAPDNIFLIMDILMKALADFSMTEKLTFSTGYLKEKNGKRFDQIINTFISNTHKFGLQIVYQATSKTRFLWCQLVSRICQTIAISISRVKSAGTKSPIDILNDKIVIFTSWMHSLSQSIAITRYIHADLHHIIAIIFWRTGVYLINTFEDLFPTYISKIQTESNKVDGSIDSTKYNMKMLNLRETYQLISSKTIHVFTVTSPAPLELPSEVARFYKTSWDAPSIESLQSALFLSASDASPWISNKTASLDQLYHLPQLNKSMGKNWPSSRLRWMITGLSSLIKGGSVNLLDKRVFLAQRHEWVAAIAEASTYALTLGPFHDLSPDLRFGITNYTLSQSAAVLSSYLVTCMLQLFYGYDDLRQFDGIIWDLDQKVRTFCDFYKRLKRPRSISIRRVDTYGGPGSLRHQHGASMLRSDSGIFDDPSYAYDGRAPLSSQRSNKSFEYSISPDTRPSARLTQRSSGKEHSGLTNRSRGSSFNLTAEDLKSKAVRNTPSRSAMNSNSDIKFRSMSILENSSSEYGSEVDSSKPVTVKRQEPVEDNKEILPPAKRLATIYQERIEAEKKLSAIPIEPLKIEPVKPSEVLQALNTPIIQDPPSKVESNSETVLVFKLGDSVDGLVKLSNGKTRWFPGMVCGVNEKKEEGSISYSYDIKYSDGDIQKDASPSEIRPTKQRTRAKPAENASKPITPSSVRESSKNPTISASQRPSNRSIQAISGNPSPRRTVVQYKLNDKVDGQVKLKNGTMRWYPGIISAINAKDDIKDVTYDINYDDGDVQQGLTIDQIRFTKQRKGSTSLIDSKKPSFLSKDSSGATTNQSLGSTNSPLKNTQEFTENGSPDGNSIPPLLPSNSPVELPVLPSFRKHSIKSRRGSRRGSNSNDSQRTTVNRGVTPQIDLKKFTSPLEASLSTGNPFAPIDSDRRTSFDMQISSRFSSPEGVSGKLVGDTVNMQLINGLALSLSAATLNAAVESVSARTVGQTENEKKKSENDLKAIQNSDVKEVENENDDYSDNDSDDSENNIFAIPSVFDGLNPVKPIQRQASKVTGSLVPKVQLSQIDVSSSSMNMAGGSLSSALLPETTEFYEEDEEEGEEEGYEIDDEREYNVSSPKFVIDRLRTLSEVWSEHDKAEEDEDYGDTDNVQNFNDDDVKTDKEPSTGDDFGVTRFSHDSSIEIEGALISSPSGIAMLPSAMSQPNTHRSSSSYLKIPLSGLIAANESNTSRGDESNRFTHREDSARLSTHRSVTLSHPGDSSALSPRGNHGSMMHRQSPTVPFSLPERGIVRQKSNSSVGKSYEYSNNSARGHHPFNRNPSLNGLPTADRDAISYFPDDVSTNREDEQLANLWAKPYCVIILLLIQRCLVEGLFLDSTVCFQKPGSVPLNRTNGRGSADLNTPFSGHPTSLGRGTSLAQYSLIPQQINLLFTVREFFEHIPTKPPHSISQYVTEIASLTNHATVRIMKLLSPNLFQNCLVSHLSVNGRKIGDGGFGSVYRVCCPGHSCGRFSIQEKTSNAAGIMCIPSPKNNNFPFMKSTRNLNAQAGSRKIASDCYYAVKRIPRERSVHDPATVFSLFNEVTCLELLSNQPMHGVSPLYDYGVSNGEYWLVLELGGCNLLEWRETLVNDTLPLEAIFSSTVAVNPATPSTQRRNSLVSPPRASSASQTVANRSHSASTSGVSTVDSLNLKNIVHCLMLYTDAALIIQAVHDLDIAHFDIKCNNFIVRHHKLDFKAMAEAHRLGIPSGALFLTDFGESVPYISKYNERVSAGLETIRCRGTLPIQSPEQLALSDESHTSNPMPAVSSVSSIALHIPLPSNVIRSPPTTSNRAKSKESSSKAPRIKFVMPDCQSDIWSLGAMLVELVTGIFLFAERSWPDLFVRCCLEVFPPLPLENLRLSITNIRSQSIKNRIEEIVKSSMRQIPSTRTSIQELVKNVASITKELILEMIPSTPVPPSPSTIASMQLPASGKGSAIQSPRISLSEFRRRSRVLPSFGSESSSNNNIGGSELDGVVSPKVVANPPSSMTPVIEGLARTSSHAEFSTNADDFKAASLYSSVMSLPAKVKLRPSLLHLGNSLYIYLQPLDSDNLTNSDLTWTNIGFSRSPQDGATEPTSASNDTSFPFNNIRAHEPNDSLLEILGPLQLSIDSSGIDVFTRQQREKVLKSLHSRSHTIEFVFCPKYTNQKTEVITAFGATVATVDLPPKDNEELIFSSKKLASTSYSIPLATASLIGGQRLAELNMPSRTNSLALPLETSRAGSDVQSVDNSVKVENVIKQLKSIVKFSSKWIQSNVASDHAIIIAVSPCPMTTSSTINSGHVNSQAIGTISSAASSVQNPQSFVSHNQPPSSFIGQGSGAISDIGSGAFDPNISIAPPDEVEYLVSQLTMAVAAANYLSHQRNGLNQKRFLEDIAKSMAYQPVNKAPDVTSMIQEHSSLGSFLQRHNSSSTPKLSTGLSLSHPDALGSNNTLSPTNSRFTPRSSRFNKLFSGRGQSLGNKDDAGPMSPTAQGNRTRQHSNASVVAGQGGSATVSALPSVPLTDDDFSNVNKIAPHIQRACNQDLYEYLYRSID